jgi:hypothetical protein
MKRHDQKLVSARDFLIPVIAALVAGTANVQADEPVTVDNLVRAETDHMIRANMKAFGVEVGKLVHQREPVTPKSQPVIRMNQDTLYSQLILDLSEPVEITLPEVNGRYMSMHVIDQDHSGFRT